MRSSMMMKVPASLIAAVLAVAFSAPAAQAQSPGFAAKMDVPFAFQTASGQHFAPGVYTKAGMAMTQMASDGLPATQGKAVFTHYGDQYFLRSVWVAGNTSHLICNSSKAERKSQIAAGKTSTAVEVALLQPGR
jgi:hypothetical protein